MNREPIVITGVGLTCAGANSLDELRRNVLNKEDSCDFAEVPVVGKIRMGSSNYDPLKYQKKRQLKRMTRACSMGIFCAEEALVDAGLSLDSLDKNRLAIILGVYQAGMVNFEQEMEKLLSRDMNLEGWNLYSGPVSVVNSAAAEISLHMKVHGNHSTICGANAGALMSLESARRQLWLGEADYVLAGGVDSSATGYSFHIKFNKQNQLACDPNETPDGKLKGYGEDSQGTVLAEGGAIFVLERLSDAKARGAKIYGVLGSYREYNGLLSNEQYLLPHQSTTEKLLTNILKDEKLTPEDVDFVNGEAWGTNDYDLIELNAIKNVLNDTLVNGNKSNFGNTMGAAGALELAAQLLSFQDDTIAANANINKPLSDNVLLKNKNKKINNFIKLSLAELGHHVGMMIKRYDEE